MDHNELLIIKKYFPSLTDSQLEKIAALPELYKEWNEKINVISRKDIDNIVINHIMHSMCIGLFARFSPETKIFDIGTGGGFPGIPMAILFPECHFTLIDSIGKKIRVADNIARQINLDNVKTVQVRAEQYTDDKCHFMISRAAMAMKDLIAIARQIVDIKDNTNIIKNGIIALKGGDLTDELKLYRKSVVEQPISEYVTDVPFFETKKIVYFPIR